MLFCAVRPKIASMSSGYPGHNEHCLKQYNCGDSFRVHIYSIFRQRRFSAIPCAYLPRFFFFRLKYGCSTVAMNMKKWMGWLFFHLSFIFFSLSLFLGSVQQRDAWLLWDSLSIVDVVVVVGRHESGNFSNIFYWPLFGLFIIIIMFKNDAVHNGIFIPKSHAPLVVCMCENVLIVVG